MYFCYLRFLKLSKRVLPSRLNPRNARYFVTNLKADTVYLNRFRLHTFNSRKKKFSVFTEIFGFSDTVLYLSINLKRKL